MARKSVTETNTSSSSVSSSEQQSESKEQSQSQSTTKNFLDQELLQNILSGLVGPMTDDQLQTFAENLLKPQLSAGLEASQQQYETTKLAKEQEIANLASNLQKGIEEQNKAYGQSIANVETAALARGMGRSSYTIQSLANQGNALAKAVQQLTDESARQSAQIQDQITQAAQQNTQTQNRLNTDYATQLAAKIQELKEQQRQEYNQNYMTAVSGAMGQQTTGTSQSTGSTHTTGTEKTDSTSHSVSVTTSGGSSGGSKGGGTFSFKNLFS